ncbi:MAG: alpha/beta hydrolase [Planctomycetes bacterium]|nr:alpha/beta hydrolase [Planctomycetota bacterium]
MFNAIMRMLAFAVLPMTLTGCRITDWRLWHCDERSSDGYEVVHVRDISYHGGTDHDRLRHRLDLFAPKDQKNCPVIVLVHGGAWLVGDNRCCGLYTSVGEYLASQGFVVVMPNYRLSPAVKHPEHVRDVARAFAWTQRHVGEFGGRGDRISLVGHSAGGHLVALLASDEKYLNEQGCRQTDIRKVVAISGVLRIPDGSPEIFLGGASPLSIRLDSILPMRGDGTPAASDEPPRRGWAVNVSLGSFIFGDDPEVRRLASPTSHVRPNMPPFLFITADKDLPMLPQMAEEMHRAMRLHGCDARLLRVPNRNHNSIIFSAITPRDPVASAVVDFLREPTSRAP